MDSDTWLSVNNKNEIKGIVGNQNPNPHSDLAMKFVVGYAH